VTVRADSRGGVPIAGPTSLAASERRTLARELQALRAQNEQLTAEIARREVADAERVRLAEEVARDRARDEFSQLKSQFVAIASHELRTPLTAVMGYTELLLHDQTVEPDVRAQWLGVVNRAAQQLECLVDNLLDVSRLETGCMAVELTPVDLAAVVEMVLEPLRKALADHSLVVDLAPDARVVQADPEKLRQIVANLVSNAIKFSPGGGRVEVAAGRDAAGWVRLSVSDQGLGIPADQLEGIFDRFQRVDSTSTRHIRGTGLGLYIVRELLALHGGAIRVESELGRGSVFHATLPAAAS
jgi:signal transduction histidine kinase